VEVLEADTMEGRDPYKLFLRRTRLPKNWKDVPGKGMGLPN